MTTLYLCKLCVDKKTIVMYKFRQHFVAVAIVQEKNIYWRFFLKLANVEECSLFDPLHRAYERGGGSGGTSYPGLGGGSGGISYPGLGGRKSSVDPGSKSFRVYFLKTLVFLWNSGQNRLSGSEDVFFHTLNFDEVFFLEITWFWTEKHSEFR